MKTPTTYRLKVTSTYETGPDTYTYLIRDRNGCIRYFSAEETQLALSNLLGRQAAETRFALEDAESGETAAKILRNTLGRIWAKNPDRCPKVGVLACSAF